MADEDTQPVEALSARDHEVADSVVIRPNPFTCIGRAAGSAPALAITALITATATILSMSVANDIADAKLYSSRGFNSLDAIRWASATRLIIAGLALLVALVAGVRYAHGLPATRYTFSDDGEEATEDVEGAEAPAWVRMLIGSGFVVSLIAVVLNTVALLITLHLHESPNFGVAPG